MKVFWSWQNDLPTHVARGFIKAALEDALVLVAEDLALTEVERPELDHDTKNEAGLVEIVATIFKKIEGATAFVADVTPVAQVSEGNKWVPNPNVMIELGFALKALGREGILLVWNRAFGGTPETLPFDLRHRRAPISFNLAPSASASERGKERKRLTLALAEALKVNLAAELLRRDAQVEMQRQLAIDGNPAIWFQPKETIEHHDFFQGSGPNAKWNVSDVMPKAYLRICPGPWLKNRPSRNDVQKVRDDLRLRAFGQWTSGDGGANAHGVIAVGTGLDPKNRIAHGVAQWFLDTGEIWGFNTKITGLDQNRTFLSDYRIRADWLQFLARSVALLKELGAPLPFEVEAGVAGLEGVYWPATNLNALTKDVAFRLRSREWDLNAQSQFVGLAVNALRDAFNLPPAS